MFPRFLKTKVALFLLSLERYNGVHAQEKAKVMEPQTVTLHLPDATYRRLVEMSTKSERPLPEETVHLLTSALASNEALASDITARLEHLFLLTDEDNELMQGLLEKRQRAGLTSNESEQLQVLSAHFNQIMMTRAKSAAILLERGHDISALSPH